MDVAYAKPRITSAHRIRLPDMCKSKSRDVRLTGAKAIDIDVLMRVEDITPTLIRRVAYTGDHISTIDRYHNFQALVGLISDHNRIIHSLLTQQIMPTVMDKTRQFLTTGVQRDLDRSQGDFIAAVWPCDVGISISRVADQQ
jgi:hypothetical protein